MNKLMPHPVLGNQDDFPKATFQCLVESRKEDDRLVLNYSIKCEEPALSRLVEEGAADFLVETESPGVLGSRRCHTSQSAEGEFSIPTGLVGKAVHVRSFVVARIDLEYSPENAHRDHKGTTFGILKNEIVARDPQNPVRIKLADDGPAPPIAFVRSPHPDQKNMTVRDDEDRLCAVLPQARYDEITRRRDPYEELLVLTLLLQYIIPTLHEKDEPWADAIREAIGQKETQHMTPEEILQAAQNVLGNPFHMKGSQR